MDVRKIFKAAQIFNKFADSGASTVGSGLGYYQDATAKVLGVSIEGDNAQIDQNSKIFNAIYEELLKTKPVNGTYSFDGSITFQGDKSQFSTNHQNITNMLNARFKPAVEQAIKRAVAAGELGLNSDPQTWRWLNFEIEA